jgi:hypothetical protein
MQQIAQKHLEDWIQGTNIQDYTMVIYFSLIDSNPAIMTDLYWIANICGPCHDWLHPTLTEWLCS